MKYSVIAQYSPSQGEKEEEVRVKFSKIPDGLRTRFGGVTSKVVKISKMIMDHVVMFINNAKCTTCHFPSNGKLTFARVIKWT